MKCKVNQKSRSSSSTEKYDQVKRGYEIIMFTVSRNNIHNSLRLIYKRSICTLYFSASLTILSISSLLRRPLSFVMVILFSRPVDLSQADTFKIPLASMSKVTSICGTPRGAGGMLVSSNLPNRLLSLVMARSPSNTYNEKQQDELKEHDSKSVILCRVCSIPMLYE